MPGSRPGNPAVGANSTKTDHADLCKSDFYQVNERREFHYYYRGMKKVGHILGIIGIGVLALVLGLLIFAMLWTMDIWRHITFDEIVYHLFAPIKGTNPDVIWSFIFRALTPSLLIAAALVTLNIVLKKKENKQKLVKIINVAVSLVLVVSLGITTFCFCNKYDVVGYFQNIGESSDFIQDNYVDPNTVVLQAPGEQRNLIYIFLESMEATYSDKDSGGAYDDNYIPNLTNYALNEGCCFNGSTGKLNGALSLHGATFTSGAMVAQTAGLPAMEEVGNAAGTQDTFYPGATTIGDILAKEGYNQELLVGSDAVFGGRAQYFSGHGNYKIFDYVYAMENGYIPQGYKVWWGYEDTRLFEFAKEEILDLASKPEPFNFTMLTVDTHFEDGWVCDLCEDKYPGNQYANVIACSDKQVFEFVEWIKAQEFYENTTIVICGDHITMDSNFCEKIEPSYERKTFCVILNAVPAEPAEERYFSTFDLFPTTLAALGWTIEGDRLGLGTNLYSDTKTLVEEYGTNYVNGELKKNSDFIKDVIAAYNPFDAEVFKTNSVLQLSYDPVITDGRVDQATIKLEGIEITDEPIQAMTLTISNEYGTDITTYDMALQGDLSYTADFDVSRFADATTERMTITVTDMDGDVNLIYENYMDLNDPYFYLNRDIDEFLTYVDGQADVTILAATSQDASRHIADSTLALLRDNFGLEAGFDEGFGMAWYGVATNGGEVIAEGCSADEQVISSEGTLPGGQTYSIAGTGYDKDDAKFSTILVDGVNYAPGLRGLCFVVVDNQTGEVLDVATFDTYYKSYTPECTGGEVSYTITNFFGTRCNVAVNDVASEINLNNTGTADLYVWDADNVGSPDYYELVFDSASKSYACSFDMKDYDPETTYMSIYIKKAGGKILLRYKIKL